ncbi:MAG: hypothetical protein KKE39_09610 [Bacteroidetes bacterium]|nr:hypothetical protein [Bacteroidota bacterium]MBU1372490.1 hypothetical protein [Bacteroidota bacterium]MBU1485101.1 hypothetical protein [Bacteroidota bacterium]MBU1762040.1 hypothetical protein [Bacteroidota bacterium]MBU2045268.1 hypothetical protein [Bacteroidota bacterium]
MLDNIPLSANTEVGDCDLDDLEKEQIDQIISFMANSNNPLLKGFRGHINKTIVVKQYPGNRTIITAYPDMSKVKPTAAQLAAKSHFEGV